MDNLLDWDRLKTCCDLSEEAGYWSYYLRPQNRCERHFLELFMVGEPIRLETALLAIGGKLAELKVEDKYMESVEERKSEQKYQLVRDLEYRTILAYATMYWLLQLTSEGTNRFQLSLVRLC